MCIKETIFSGRNWRNWLVKSSILALIFCFGAALCFLRHSCDCKFRIFFLSDAVFGVSGAVFLLPADVELGEFSSGDSVCDLYPFSMLLALVDSNILGSLLAVSCLVGSVRFSASLWGGFGTSKRVGTAHGINDFRRLFMNWLGSK